MSLKKQAIAGMIWSYGQQFASQLIAFLVTLILARILLPEEFGLIGMIAIFMGIGTVLFNGGLASSLIRTSDCTQKDYSTVFYFNIIGSVIVYLILFFSAPLIADFFNQEILKNITRLYGLTFIISSLSTVHNTILTKELQFKKQTLITLPALIISSIVGVILALNNYGVWSLVWSAIVNSFLTTVILWISSDWKPKFLFCKDKFREHFHFGYKLTLSSLLDIIFTNIYQIIIGRTYNAALVGHYTRANQLMMLPVGNVSGAVQKVVFPLFSQIQNDLPRFKNVYKKIMMLLLLIITPIIVLMGVLAQPLITFLFTEKWLPAVSIFQVICFSGVLYPLHSYNLLVLQVKGRSDLFLKLEIFKKLLLSIILLISFLFGFYILLLGQLIFSVLALFINTHYAGSMLNYTVLQQLKDILPIIGLGLVMGIIIYGIDLLLGNYSDLVRLLCGGAGGLIAYMLLVKLFANDSIDYVKELIQKR